MPRAATRPPRCLDWGAPIPELLLAEWRSKFVAGLEMDVGRSVWLCLPVVGTAVQEDAICRSRGPVRRQVEPSARLSVCVAAPRESTWQIWRSAAQAACH